MGRAKRIGGVGHVGGVGSKHLVGSADHEGTNEVWTVDRLEGGFVRGTVQNQTHAHVKGNFDWPVKIWPPNRYISAIVLR